MAILINEKLYDVVYYVSKTGSDANDGLTVTTPKLTIGAAIALVSAGDAILVGPGTYTAATDTAFLIPNNVDLIGSGRNNTIITANSAQVALTEEGCIVKPGTNSLIQGLTIKGTSPSTYQACVGAYNDGAGVLQAAFTNALVRDCWLDAGTDGVYLGGGSLGVSDITLEDCLITTQWHAVVAFNDTTSLMKIRMRNCVLEAVGPSSIVGGQLSSGTAAVACRLKAAIYAHNCVLRAADGPSGFQQSPATTPLGTSALHVYEDSSVTGYPFVLLESCALHAKSSNGGLVLDIRNDETGAEAAIYAMNCAYRSAQGGGITGVPTSGVWMRQYQG
jgi:hypothetical protein